MHAQPGRDARDDGHAGTYAARYAQTPLLLALRPDSELILLWPNRFLRLVEVLGADRRTHPGGSGSV